MIYDFNKEIDRHGSGALKVDALQERYGRPDLQGLWVADMDFATPPFIVEAMRKRLEHPILGYTIEPKEYRPAIANWLKDRHGWEVEPEWLCYIPGVVKGIGMALNVLTEPGDGVIIQPPVYHIFKGVIEGNGRSVVNNPLRERPDGLYDMDLDDLREKARDAKVLLLSNPHNPGGVVWSRETLREVADICRQAGVTIISDEIHADMTLWGHRHTPLAKVAGGEGVVTLGAPSKTFNMPGVVTSYAVVSDPELRRRFYGWLEANELWEPDIFAPIATIAAYSPEGEEWRRQMLDYVQDNIDYVVENVRAPIRAIKPESSFLVNLDCRALGLDGAALVDLFVNKARLALNDGRTFGPGGLGFMRLNVATPRPALARALDSLTSAFEGL